MEMTELWKANIRLSTAPWKSPRRREIPTFPQLRRRVVLRERKRTQKEKTEGRLHKNLDTAPPSAADIHAGGPAASHRSWLWSPPACLFVASVPPRSDRNWPASAPVPATARALSNQQKPRASSSVHPGNAPS